MARLLSTAFPIEEKLTEYGNAVVFTHLAVIGWKVFTAQPLQ